MRENRNRHILTGVGIALLTAVFILLLLVALSTSIIKTIYLLNFHVAPRGVIAALTDTTASIKFGVWGFCAEADGTQLCEKPQLGYTVPDFVETLVHLKPGTLDEIKTVTTAVLVLFPIAAGFAFLALIASCINLSGFGIIALILSIITAILSTAVFAIGIAFVVIARKRIPTEDDLDFNLMFGNAVWMLLAAVICIWIVVILLSVKTCCLRGRRDNYHHKHVVENKPLVHGSQRSDEY